VDRSDLDDSVCALAENLYRNSIGRISIDLETIDERKAIAELSINFYLNVIINL
jgi:hypothetical protein